MITEPHELTEQEHETLRSAMERGDYEISRWVTTTGLDEELGVSHQAVSERLRCSHLCLVERGHPTPRK
ncbi:helix-turn-helix domain-containing protein (plasmid) [Haladaptatus sp. SPP-AMP-3]|uniref:helix-turn-helix domain-containing protein n=1 Tax=Haladaptatus sp. SPP-AMP-3 TaxID=3121295 RepID=UPI003C2BD01D